MICRTHEHDGDDRRAMANRVAQLERDLDGLLSTVQKIKRREGQLYARLIAALRLYEADFPTTTRLVRIRGKRT